MRLINKIKKTVDVMRLINEGNDAQAASMLGLTLKSGMRGSFLERVSDAAWLMQESHNGGVLVSSNSKGATTVGILNSMFTTLSDLNESVSMIAANTMSAMSTLCESSNGMVNTPALTSMQFDGVKDAIHDGLTVERDGVCNMFNSSVSLMILGESKFQQALDGAPKSGLYMNLLKNAFAGTTGMLTLNKIVEFNENNAHIVTEAMNAYNIPVRADTVMFDTLDLQESHIDMLINMTKFNNELVKALNENKLNFNGIISGCVDKAIIPICENRSAAESPSLVRLFNTSICSMAALYDEYIQDICVR